MSRGIPRTEAELMVTEGFFEELLERIPFERVQDRLRAALEAKIVGQKSPRRKITPFGRIFRQRWAPYLVEARSSA